LLLQDHNDRTQDETTEADVARHKIKAVYGRIDTFEKLSLETGVTEWLGRVRTISESEVRTGSVVTQR
jgi:hypothetical protein